jgi:REP element-mobilizing transposase RayT
MRARKVPTQLALDLTAPTWGGTRDGAGRKRLANKHDASHETRPEHVARFPVHVVLRTRREVKRLRRGYVLRKVRRALHVVAAREDGFRVVHMSIQHNHLHLLVEAENKLALSRGMQAFAISAARAINRSQNRTGKVFAFRYHATAITSRRQTRHALAYVLNNWRRHEEDRRSGRRAARALVDPYSSGVSFQGWSVGAFEAPDDYVPLAVSAARTWLLREGWKMYGAIEPREVPGKLT